VSSALACGAPVVALESTIISHGMPYPANVETALAVEAEVRRFGATPATVALSGGRIHVGLSGELLEALARAGPDARKASRRDLASVLAGGGLGATTVAGTMIAADAAGIPVFATGGIGGVHRGGEVTLDVSADLAELGRTPVAVVCAGVKSLLDIGRTLEVLETQGVPVVTLGGGEFPAFFSARSGVRSPDAVASPAAAAALLAASRALRLRNGAVIAVPPPATLEGDAAEAAIQTALLEAAAAGVSGRDVTPFLLRRVAELTGGASLAANIALIKRNAGVAAEIAVELARLEAGGGGGGGGGAGAGGATAAGAGARGRRHFSSSPFPTAVAGGGGRARHPANGAPSTGPIAVFGGSVLDLLARPQPGSALTPGSSSPGAVTQSAGGVGRNIGEALARLCAGGEPRVVLTTALGDDPAGRFLRAASRAAGLSLLEGAPPPSRSATYCAMLDGGGELVAAVVDFCALEGGAMSPAALGLAAGSGAAAAPSPVRSLLADARAVVCDANLPADTLRAVAAAAAAAGAPLVLEPISVAKGVRMVRADVLHCATVMKPNALEVEAMAAAWREAVGLPPLPEEGAGEGGEGGEGGEDGGGEGGATQEFVVEAGGGGEGEEGGGGGAALPACLTARLLVAAQSRLAARLREGGCARRVGEGAVSGEDARAAYEAGAARVSGPKGAATLAPRARAPEPAPAAAAAPSTLLEGRKHLFVSLGEAGVLWLSAAPLRSARAEDLAAALPFFAAAAHPQVDFDFQLLPAPRLSRLAKVTGAGDCFVAGLVWAVAVRGERVAEGARWGLAGARAALETEPTDGAGGAIPAQLSPQLLERLLEGVDAVEAGYT